ncbi:MAG: DnaJ domain-containing protein [Bacteroidia bacterium]|nr:DnaJ domain-containing protein [Bacteroidia bacterium]
MPDNFTLYDLLGLSETATSAEIKAAYRELAMKYHPDTNPDPDAHKQFVAINAAHETLSDPLKRKMYDLRRSAGDIISGAPSGPRRPGPDMRAENVDHEEMRRRYWASPAGQRKKREMEREASFFDKVRLGLRIISIPLAVFFILILAEGWFANEIRDQSVVYLGMKLEESGKFYSHYQMGEESFRVNAAFEECIDPDKVLNIRRGNFFGILTAVELNKACRQGESWIDPNQSLFGGPGFLLYLGLILIAALWSKQVKLEFMAGFGFFLLAITGIIVILFLRLWV